MSLPMSEHPIIFALNQLILKKYKDNGNKEIAF
jgi:hypothetical protein